MAGRLGIGLSANGKYTTFPTVVSIVNADDLDLRPVTSIGVVAILAQGAGFFPPKVATSLPLGLGSPQRFLSASDLLTAANYASRPFVQFDRGAGQVLIVPVNPSTTSTKTVSSSTPVLLLTLTSKIWGLTANAIQVKTETGKLSLRVPQANGGYITEVFEVGSGTINADAQAVAADINERSQLVAAAWSANGTWANVDWAAMTGGTEPAAINQDWADALNALNGFGVNTIAVCSPTPAVWAMLGDYCIAKRCRGFIGRNVQNWNGVSNRATAITNLKGDVSPLNAIRLMHVGIGMDGLPGYVSTAPRYAALAALLDPSVPMTFKDLGAASLETRLDVDTEVGGIDGLLLAGVAPPVPDQSTQATFIVSRGLSTWTGDDNLYHREQSVLAAVDAVRSLLEAGCRQFLGNEGTAATGKRCEALVDQILNECTKQNATVRINGYRRESIHVEIHDMTMTVAVSFTPIPPLNFIILNLKLERTDIDLSFDVALTAAAA